MCNSLNKLHRKLEKGTRVRQRHTHVHNPAHKLHHHCKNWQALHYYEKHAHTHTDTWTFTHTCYKCILQHACENVFPVCLLQLGAWTLWLTRHSICQPSWPQSFWAAPAMCLCGACSLSSDAWKRSHNRFCGLTDFNTRKHFCVIK